jgi:hypothetical protein
LRDSKEVIAKREVATLLVASGAAGVDVVRVGPIGGSVKEGIDRVVGVGDVGVPEARERPAVGIDRLELENGDLDIDDGLCGQSRDCGGADMIDTDGSSPERCADELSLGIEPLGPERVVGDDLEPTLHEA